LTYIQKMFSAPRQNLHFHSEPRIADNKRIKRLKTSFPRFEAEFDLLWGIYARIRLSLTSKHGSRSVPSL